MTEKQREAIKEVFIRRWGYVPDRVLLDWLCGNAVWMAKKYNMTLDKAINSGS